MPFLVHFSLVHYSQLIEAKESGLNWAPGGFRGSERAFLALAMAAQILPRINAAGVAVQPVELKGIRPTACALAGLAGGAYMGSSSAGFFWARPACAPPALRSSLQVAHGQARRSQAKFQALRWPSTQSISRPLPSVSSTRTFSGVTAIRGSGAPPRPRLLPAPCS